MPDCVQDPIIIVPVNKPKRRQLYEILEGDPWTFRRQQDLPTSDSKTHARWVGRLLKMPDDVAAYVTARLPLKSSDWWWMRRSDKHGTPYIEVSIREERVLEMIREAQ